MLQVWRLDHPLWLAPHRPFFLSAGLWAALAPLVWLLPEDLGPEPLPWHRHELLFGMGGAAVGGYLLTALPAWTAGDPVRPAATRLLFLLWLAARLAFAAGPSAIPAALAGSCYFFALAGFLLQGVGRAKAWHRLPLAAAPLFPGLFELFAVSEFGPAGNFDFLRMPVLFYGLLISLIGGRAVAAFTIHSAARSRPETRIADPRWMHWGAIATLIGAIILLFAGAAAMAGRLMILSGALQFARMLPWRSWRSAAYPALLLLHLAWLWLALGLAVAGIALLPASALDPAAGLHALTMGAMGTMMMAMMGRAAMVRQEARLLVSPALAFAFALVFLAAPFRLGMACMEPAGQAAMLRLSAMVWSGGWALFVWDFRRALRGPVPRPVLSARIPVTIVD
jgi:uncharacterized protein involved in response to NO